jgi:hypothetical protein
MTHAAKRTTNESGGNVSRYHLANGLHFERDGGRIVIALRTADTEHIICKVAVSEWASAVAAALRIQVKNTRLVIKDALEVGP